MKEPKARPPGKHPSRQGTKPAETGKAVQGQKGWPKIAIPQKTVKRNGK